MTLAGFARAGAAQRLHRRSQGPRLVNLRSRFPRPPARVGGLRWSFLLCCDSCARTRPAVAPRRDPAARPRCSRGRRRPTGWSTRSAPTARSAAASGSTSRTSRVTQIEGDPDSPISRGRLCPKGAASRAARQRARPREYKVKYRRPHGTEWEELDLDEAMDMIADRVIADPRRRLGGRATTEGGKLNRTHGHRAASAARRSTTRRTT